MVSKAACLIPAPTISAATDCTRLAASFITTRNHANTTLHRGTPAPAFSKTTLASNPRRVEPKVRVVSMPRAPARALGRPSSKLTRHVDAALRYNDVPGERRTTLVGRIGLLATVSATSTCNRLAHVPLYAVKDSAPIENVGLWVEQNGKVARARS
jgi:hypothetical protein